MTHRLRYAFSTLLVIGVLCPAYAAPPADTTDIPAPEALVQTELARALTSNSVQDRRRAVRRTRTYAHTNRYGKAFFADLTAHLHDIAADGQTRPLRITAVTALSAIGTDAVVRGLKAQVISFKPGPVRQATVPVIAQHDARWAIAETGRSTP